MTLNFHFPAASNRCWVEAFRCHSWVEGRNWALVGQVEVYHYRFWGDHNWAWVGQVVVYHYRFLAVDRSHSSAAEQLVASRADKWSEDEHWDSHRAEPKHKM